MIREPLKTRGVGSSQHFRWRGGDVSRLEGFSDAVFAFALTLLVVSLEVPRTFRELLNALYGFGGFAICFFAVSLVWFRHYLFFRRYGLEDGYIRVLNTVLLFLILFYVYPLKFLFTLLPGLLSGHVPVMLAPNGRMEAVIEPHQVPDLMIIYGLGSSAVFLIFGLLYLHAYHQRLALDLNPLEVSDTQESVLSNLGLMGVGLLSVAIAAGLRNAFVAGLAYPVLIPLVELIVGATMGKRRRRLEARLDTDES